MTRNIDEEIDRMPQDQVEVLAACSNAEFSQWMLGISEIDKLRATVAELRAENERLRAAIAEKP